MVSLITAVLKATVSLLVNKGRDSAVDRLKEGDVAEEQFRNMIVRELDDIKSKLDGLARKDLLTSICLFKEGIVCLYKVLDASNGGEGTATEQGGQGEVGTAGINTVSLVRRSGLQNALNDSGRRALSKAKKRFDDSRIKAIEAFNNVALSTSDRILAMQYRVMSTILEEIDNPKDAIAACKLCLEELHSMPAVIKSFKIEDTGGFWSWFKQGERQEILESVRYVNRVVFRVTEVVDGILSREFDSWPCVSIGGKEVNTLNQSNCFHLRKCSWSFGQQGEIEHKLARPWRITTNTQGHFIVVDYFDIKVFGCGGNFLHSFTISDAKYGDVIKNVATDCDDNVYVLSKNSSIHVFDKQGRMRRYFQLEMWFEGNSLTVTSNQTVFVLGLEGFNCHVTKVHMYESDGRFVKSFGREQNLGFSSCIAAAGDDEIMILTDRRRELVPEVEVFDSQGNHLRKFPILGFSGGTLMTFHLPTEHVIIATKFSFCVRILTYTKDNKHSRYIPLDSPRKIRSILGITATPEGHVAVLCTTEGNESEGEKTVVLVV
ncbi:hypothetical protein ACROYT_G013806 [Oculina patagonica]